MSRCFLWIRPPLDRPVEEQVKEDLDEPPLNTKERLRPTRWEQSLERGASRASKIPFSSEKLDRSQPNLKHIYM